MDRITKQLLSDFVGSQEIKSEKESDQFERFCNYTIVTSEYGKTFDIEAVTIGGGSDTGIDGVAIIVNGFLVEEVADVDDLLERNGSLDVLYVFVQAKTSSNIEVKELNSFYTGVLDFFAEEPKLIRNDDIKKYAEISDYILSLASSFKKNPKCKTYFITTGGSQEDENVAAVKSINEAHFKQMNIFDSVENSVIGASDLGKLYRKSKNPISATFLFKNKVTLPSVEGINESYYGILPFSEFKKLLIDNNGNIQAVFDDNVRDFIGNKNPVNKSIAETLKGKNPQLFSVLNNGVAIVANSIKTTSDTFTISDYQIVNGCQTSNVLYELSELDGIDGINIPVRLVVTEDEEIKAKIIVSTNNQTAIKKEQLSAMSDFQKNLEHYYASIIGDGRLYYERRPKQYASNGAVPKRKIITLPDQIKSFSAMIYRNPHLVTTYFGRIVKDMGETKTAIFKKDHQFAMYYLAGLAFYRLMSLFHSGAIDKKYKKVKFYIIMLVPMLSSKDEIPVLNSLKKVEGFCSPIIDKLNNEESCKNIFFRAIEIIDRSGVNVNDKEALKSRLMTDAIIKEYEKAHMQHN